MTSLSADSARFLSLSLGFVPFAFCATQFALVRAQPSSAVAVAEHVASPGHRAPVVAELPRDRCLGTDARRTLVTR